MAKKVIVLIRTSPYGMATAGEGFRAIIGLAGMGVETHAVLADDGVLVALKDQNPAALGMHKLSDAYSQLADFGAKLYLHTPSLDARSVSPENCIAAETLDDRALAALIASVDHVISFT
jgi:sulfur relay (sulfurtransferase) DsrF/TusC family protein